MSIKNPTQEEKALQVADAGNACLSYTFNEVNESLRTLARFVQENKKYALSVRSQLFEAREQSMILLNNHNQIMKNAENTALRTIEANDARLRNVLQELESFASGHYGPHDVTRQTPATDAQMTARLIGARIRIAIRNLCRHVETVQVGTNTKACTACRMRLEIRP